MRQTVFRRLLFPALAFLIVGLVSSPALAVVPVQVATYSYTPQNALAPALGEEFEFENVAGIEHTATADSPFRMWNTGSIDPGLTASAFMDWSGTFPYRCTIHPTLMRGTVRVPLDVDPGSGTTDTTFQIDALNEKLPAGMAYEIAAKRGDGEWRRIFRGRSDAPVMRMFQAGNWKLRGRLTKGPKRNRHFGRWSPISSIQVFSV